VLNEARVLLERAQAECRQLLGAKRRQLDALADALLQREALGGAELEGLLNLG
jgi:cell division protease FtsH